MRVLLHVVISIGMLAAVSVSAADVSPAPFDPALVGVWRRPAKDANGGTDTLYIDIADDGSFAVIVNTDAAPRTTGVLAVSGNKYHLSFADGSKEDGTLEMQGSSAFRFMGSHGSAAYVRAAPYLAAPPADLPLMLRTPLRSPRQLVQDRAAIERRMEGAAGAAGAAAQLEEAMQLCDAGHAGQAIAILDRLVDFYGEDNGFLYVQAQARLASGDFGSARYFVDQLLMRRPDLAEGYLDRALAAGPIGSISRLRADIAIADSLDPKQAAAFEQKRAGEIARWTAAQSKQTTAQLVGAVFKSAVTGADANALLPAALALRQAVNEHRRVPQERYQDGLRFRSGAVAANPNDPQAWADLASYVYLESPTKYGWSQSRPIEWESDRLIAMDLANQALRLDLRNVTALSTKGWLYEQDNQFKDALTVAQYGLKLAPGYPRLAELQQEILTGSSILARNQAERERARKYFTTFVPGWIITWSRGPTAAELEAAKGFDAMSASNLSQAGAGTAQAWRRYSNSIREMNAAARYYVYVGDGKDALALWSKILAIDPENEGALQNLLDYQEQMHEGDAAFQTLLRLDNVFATTAAPLVERAGQELTAKDAASAGRDLSRALAIDASNAAIYPLLAKLAVVQNRPAEAWGYLRSGEAMEMAGLRFRGIDAAGAEPVETGQVGPILGYWKAELNWANESHDAAAAQRYQALIAAMSRRILPSPPAATPQHLDALQHMKLDLLRVLIADREMAAAARRILSAPTRVGAWHGETYGAAVDVEYPIYLYLRPRLYHYQLWRYFGPGTLQTYEAYARTHPAGIDPANPPSRINHPNLAR